MNPYRSSGLENLSRPAYKRTMRSLDFDLASVANSAAKLARGAACLALVFAAHASMAAVVDDALPEAPPSPQASQIYQQRTADGRVVLTDRPAAGAVTQRTW